jgi:hypothetical protein
VISVLPPKPALASSDAPIPARADPVTFRHVEQWCARALVKHCGVDVLAGVTDELERKAKLRCAIREHSLEHEHAGNARDGDRRMTWADVFGRLYGERL